MATMTQKTLGFCDHIILQKLPLLVCHWEMQLWNSIPPPLICCLSTVCEGSLTSLTLTTTKICVKCKKRYKTSNRDVIKLYSADIPTKVLLIPLECCCQNGETQIPFTGNSVQCEWGRQSWETERERERQRFLDVVAQPNNITMCQKDCIHIAYICQ